MAASMANVSWRDLLNSHPLCKRLKESNAKESLHKQHNETKSLTCIFGGDLFIWDNSEGQILHCNLKAIKRKGNASSDANANDQPSISNLGANDLQDTQQYQRLLLSDGFSLSVEGISANRSCSHIAVWGPHGIRAVELPRRWGKNAMFEGGKETVSCRTIGIGERTFTGSRSFRIRQVSWHPGSKTDSHLAVLTSDNVFSVYSIQEPDQPLSVMNINTGDVSFTHSPSRTFVGTALGETAVAFDFGLPVTLQPKQRILQKTAKPQPVEVWPVYCVRGNGDVMLLHSHLSRFSHLKLPVQGPLVMYPPADDNYGLDACSLLCLSTPFPVIIISTCEGRLHHCVQLPGTPEDDSLSLDNSNNYSPSQSSSGVANLYEPLTEPILYVVETAELELCLSLPRFEGEAAFEDDFMCPVYLKKDGNSPDRYHCAHAAGVHSVALPWISSVQQYFLDEGGDFSMPEEKECVVEHLLCTKPLHSCPTSPILGLDVVTDPVLGPTLLILSSDHEFTALPIGLQYQMGKSRTGEESDADLNMTTPLRHHSREPFSQQVAAILKRQASNPLLKSSSVTDLSQQECFQLLSRATQVLREEYIQKQDHARQEIDTRVAILKEHKEHQLQDIKRLLDSRRLLRENAQAIAERLESSKENHEKLLKRAESVLRKLQSRVPTLSEAERQMMKDLNQIKDNVPLYSQNIEQLRLKQEYQDKQIKKAPSSGGLVLQKKQMTQIHDILKEESNDIEELRNDISRLNMELS